MKNDYEIIKDKYGERMAKLCRELFPTLLENKGVLPVFLMSTFEPNASLYDDIALGKKDSFKNFVYSHFSIPCESLDTGKSAKELLQEAGYKLYECNTYEDTLKFKPYYSKGEEICTFNDVQRCRTRQVFFAVKDNVNDIKREDFKVPVREDKYGTSVISIQFDRGSTNHVSIKNRYNHSVDNPDATFCNNLDNIIPGLTKAFEKDYNLNINKVDNKALELYDYVICNGKYYKYNYELNDKFYCPNNIIIDNGEVIKFDTSRYKLVDYLLVDYSDKTIKPYDSSIEESFIVTDISKINVERVRNTNEVMIDVNCPGYRRISLQVDPSGKLIALADNKSKRLDDYYLYNNRYLRVLSLNNNKEIGDNVLYNNQALTILDIATNESIGESFLATNSSLKEIELPNTKAIGSNSFAYAANLKKIDAPNVENIADNTFILCDELEEANLPNVRYIGNNAFSGSTKVKKININNLEKAGYSVFGGTIDMMNMMVEVINNNARRKDVETNRENDSTSSSGKKL